MRVLKAGSMVVVLFLVLAGCGGGGGGDDTADEPGAAATDVAAQTVDAGPTEDTGGAVSGFGAKPCDLLSQADVEAAAGTSGMAPTSVPIDASSGLCGYQAADSSAEVVLSVWDGARGEGLYQTLDFLLTNGAADLSRVDNLGGDAIFSSTDGTLFVRKGGTAVQLAVRVPALDAAAIRDAAVELGRKVLDRL
jgi:hypothetical protein